MGLKLWNYNLVTQPATVITATTENALYPLANFKDPRKTKVYRSTGTSTSIVFDFVTTEAVDSILLVPHAKNGWGFDTPVTVEANATNTWGAPAFTTTIVSGDVDQAMEICIKEFAAQSYRFWRLTFTGTSYVEVAKIFIGSLLEVGTGRTFEFGWYYQERDLSRASFNRYGQKFVDVTSSQKIIACEFALLNRDEIDSLFQLWDVNKTYVPFWMWVDGVNTLNNTKRHAGVFYFDQMPAAQNTFHALYSMAMQLSEAT